MLIYDKYGNRPTKGAHSFDRFDGKPLIAKCGEIKSHHWARKTKIKDSWYEPETDWHLRWKSLFPARDTEQVVEVDGERHRMDARTKINGKWYVVEFQNSPISPEEVRQRNEGYKKAGYEKVIWVWNGATTKIKMRDEPARSNYNLTYTADLGANKYSVWHCEAAVIDGKDGIFQVAATPEYKGDCWYLQSCYPDELQITLTHGILHPNTQALNAAILEGAV